MILYYAPGGGYGHVSRGFKILAACEKESDAAIICSPDSVIDESPLPATLIPIPRESKDNPQYFRKWLDTLIGNLQPERIYIDTFPAGLLGELLDSTNIRMFTLIYIARRMKWSVYATTAASCSFTFKNTYVVEPLEQLHYDYISTTSEQVAALRLPYVSTEGMHSGAKEVKGETLPVWGIVHSGVQEEVNALITYARQSARFENKEVRYVVIAPEAPKQLPCNVSWRHYFPASDLFPYFDRIFTGCGFNAMHETRPFRGKHRWIPFKRHFDNQFWRAEYHKRKTALFV